MARTKSSRGVAPFKMRSGNSPLPLFGAIGMGINKLLGKNPKPPSGPDGGLKEKIDEIHAATAGGGGESSGIVGGVNSIAAGGEGGEAGAKGGSKIQAAIDAAGGSTDPKVIAAQLLKEKANETGEIPTV